MSSTWSSWRWFSRRMAFHSAGSDWASRFGANMADCGQESRRFYGNFARVKLALLVLALVAAPLQAFPTKPVRVIVAFTPGGVTDIIARTLLPQLAERWGQ